MTDKNTTDDRRTGFAPAPGRDDPGLDPFEIEFRPEYLADRGPRGPFVNDFGIVIGDHDYESPESPLEQWSEETDPAVMAGDQWVHPFKDIGFRTRENRDLFEKGIAPSPGSFMHPAHQSSGSERFEPGFDPDEDEFASNSSVPEVLDEP